MLSKEGLYKKNPKYREKVDSIIYNKTLELILLDVYIIYLKFSNNIITVNIFLNILQLIFSNFITVV